jgi:hypothetical protein
MRSVRNPKPFVSFSVRQLQRSSARSHDSVAARVVRYGKASARDLRAAFNVSRLNCTR